MRTAAALLVVLGALARPAEGKPRDGEAVLFARDGALWKVSARGGKAEKVVELDERARAVDRIEAAAGSILVVASSARRWIRDGAARSVVCGPAASSLLAADGTRITCAIDADTDMVYELEGGRRTARVARDPGLVSPDGARAVAVDDGALVTYKLDARRARRVLMKEASPLAWSGDGQWLLVHHRDQACIIRAVGGQYKCWTGFRGVALAADGMHAVLAKAGAARTDLYVAQLAGAHAEAPAVLAREVDGAAAWLGVAGPPTEELSLEVEEGGPE